MRTCACAGASLHCCAVHAVAQLLRNKSAGATPFRPHKLLVPQGCPPLLTLLGHKVANRCTLIPFWAGRATSLAAAGSGTARPMRSPSLPSSRWSALKTRTEWHRRGEKCSWKAERYGWKKSWVEPTRKERHRWEISAGYCGEPGVLCDYGVPLLTLVAIQPVTSVGWRRPNVVALGHLVRVSRCTR